MTVSIPLPAKNGAPIYKDVSCERVVWVLDDSKKAPTHWAQGHYDRTNFSNDDFTRKFYDYSDKFLSTEQIIRLKSAASKGAELFVNCVESVRAEIEEDFCKHFCKWSGRVLPFENSNGKIELLSCNDGEILAEIH